MTDTFCGFVSLIGASNVGKSTLMNRFIGEKVSIVTPKVQTTRSRIRGIYVKDNTQIVFVDTPGVFQSKTRLEKAMVSSAFESISDADEVLFLVDALKGMDKNTSILLDRLKETHQNAILVINKIDLVSKEQLLPLIERLNKTGVFTDTFLVSAEKGDCTETLLDFLVKKMPPLPFMFPADEVSDLPNRLFTAEITREKLFLFLQQELPYSIAVKTSRFEDKGDKGLVIEQNIFTQRDSQKAIILGKKGSMIKKIGMSSKAELEKLFERPIHLYLFVKVKSKWEDDPSFYQSIGLDFNA
ncbi:MAG: GTPase Era [Alphaproteobacteria bacterium]|nr:GTPase Era [Alphaproteobacteria bacterium]